MRKAMMKRWTPIVVMAVMVMAQVGLAQVAAPPGAVTKDDIKVRKLSGTKVKTPQYRISGGAVQGASKDWYEISTIYDTKPEWANELNFTYYVLVRSTKGKRAYTLFRGSVDYVNIARGSRHVSTVYLHPNTLARYGDVERMAVIIKSGGRVVAMESEPSAKNRWWEQLTPVDGYVLNRLETPFAMINFDNYEAIKAATPK
jgi:hypothetical protein